MGDCRVLIQEQDKSRGRLIESPVKKDRPMEIAHAQEEVVKGSGLLKGLLEILHLPYS